MALLEFFGDTCPHCLTMKPMIERVEKSVGVTLQKFEVWSNDENAKKLSAIDKGLCGGVPFFYNDETKTFICGATDEKTLTAWMKGEKEKGIGQA